MGYRLVEERGEIEELLFSGGDFPDNPRVERQLYDIYALLVREVPDTAFLVTAEAAPHLRRGLLERDIETGDFKLYEGPHFVFARDIFFCSLSFGKPVIQTTGYKMSSGLRDVIKTYTEEAGLGHRYREFIKAPGGNVIASDGKLFVAMHALLDTAHALFMMETGGRVSFDEHFDHFYSESRSMYRACFGGEIVEIGTREIPSITGKVDEDQHLDMIMTFPTADTALVASTELALDRLSDMKKTRAKKMMTNIVLQTGKLTGEEILKVYKEENGRDSVAEYLDTVAGQLESRGYNVIRLPYLDHELEPSDGARRYIPPISYFNVLYHGKKVFVPVYDIHWDDEAIGVYRDLGYEVVPVPATILLSAGGGLRCISNVLRRRNMRGK
ncbi:MAG: agmatine deiminase family protein [bacterium]|nr:agmatine deiminase family protein [bacterium]